MADRDDRVNHVVALIEAASDESHGVTAAVEIATINDASAISLGVHASHGPHGDHFRRVLLTKEEVRRVVIALIGLLTLSTFTIAILCAQS